MYPIWQKIAINYLDQRPFRLNSHNINIWKIALNEDFPQANSLINQQEAELATKFYAVKHQQQFIKVRAFTRLILAKYLHIHPLQCQFRHNKYGKPKVTNHPLLEFNLSHSGHIALLAITNRHPIGIDLEQFPSRLIPQIVSSLPNQLESQPKYLQKLSFINLWTQKEASVKAQGLSLSTNRSCHGYHILTFTPQIGYKGAICYPQQYFSFDYYQLIP